MIDLLLILALQMSEPELRTDSVTYAMPALQITPEIAPMIDTYYRCAFPDAFGTHKVVMGKEEANARVRMTACGEVRRWAVSAAISAYKPQPGGEKDATTFVNRAFDSIDAGQIGLARMLDGLPLSPGTQVTAPPADAQPSGNPSPPK
jgi:hypothetical protein